MVIKETIQDEVKETIKEGYLYDPVAKKPRKATDEEHVRQELIKTLASEYGYSLENMATEFPIKVGSSTKRIDIAIFKDDSPHFQENIELIVECKKPSIKLTDKEHGVGQLISYISVCPASKFGLWTNGPGFSRQVVHKVEPSVVEKVEYDIPRHGTEISDDKGPLIDDLVAATSESLKWRFRRCHDIISTSGDDKMTAFWEFLKVIQTKIEDEKEDKSHADFYATRSELKTLDGNVIVSNRINKLYKRLVMTKYGNVSSFQGDKINIRPAALCRIITELQNYSLLVTGPTVKGAAYEEIVGANLRGDKGEFFTPRVAIDAAVEMLNIKPDDVCTDPACGSGGFTTSMLLAGMKSIEKKYAKRKGDFKETIRDEQNAFARNNIIANDINRNLANACRMNMAMNNDNASLVFDQDILEPPQNWTCERNDILKDKYGLKTVKVAGHKFMVGNATAIGTNPPFGDNITRTESYILEQYELAKNKSSQIVEILFMERIVQLLKPGVGRAAIVVPQSILNNPGLAYVREWLMAHTKILGVIELPVETFLISGREGTGTLTAILVVERRSLEETVSLINGQQQENYPIFMAVANKVGYDRRGKTIYRSEKDGTEIVHEVPILDPHTNEVMSMSKEKIIANDLPEIINEYLAFVDKYNKGHVFYDVAEEVYRVI